MLLELIWTTIEWFAIPLIAIKFIESIDSLVDRIIFGLFQAHTGASAEQLRQLCILRANLDELLQADLSVIVRVHPLKDELDLFLVRRRVRAEHLIQTLQKRKIVRLISVGQGSCLICGNFPLET